MEASTTIKQMLAGNRIFVPSYQRAYSWETELEKANSPKQTNVFLSDLEDYNKSSTKSRYYFGHFLFEDKEDKKFGKVSFDETFFCWIETIIDINAKVRILI
jgi:uncharacterized protein with ParB-like and HNH nuclease domain